MRHILALLLMLQYGGMALAAEPPRNLATTAQATASESQDDLLPQKAADGNLESRWSGIPGHNAGVWYQLDWKEPVQVGEIIIHQYDRYAMEWDVQVRGDPAAPWQTVQHFGRPGQRLPLVVTCRFAPRKITGLRIGNITNGPSFTEVEVHEHAFAQGIATCLASDLRGNFIGIVSDQAGSAPVENAEVALGGQAAGGAWEVTARTDNKGLFSLPMPLGLRGPVKVRTTCSAANAELPAVEKSVNATSFQYGLIPRGLGREAINLNGRWRFCVEPPDGFWKPDFDDTRWTEIAVPAHWEIAGYHTDAGVGGYRLSFSLPGGEGRLKLRFEGVYSGAEVWLNGQLVAEHEGMTPFECDITDAAQAGDNLLALRVREHTTVSDHLDHMSLYADFHLAGIFRGVSVLRVPDVHIGAIELTTSFDRDYRQATLTAKVTVLNESPKAFAGELALRLIDPTHHDSVVTLKPQSVQLDGWKRADLEFTTTLDSPRTWTAEHPNLYHLAASIRPAASTEPGDELKMTLGFRQTEVRGTEILINGKPVKIRGTCHHDVYPTTGRVVTAELQRRDLTLMRGANLNAVRTSHYPPTPELLDIADELGLYVEDEASFCWSNGTNDLRNTPRIIQLEAELLARDRNHPSVAFWSICNESEFGYGFQRAHEWVRKADPSRPTGAAISEWLELATLHNPLAIKRIDENEHIDKPLLFDESLCIYQGIFGDVAEMWVDPGIRDYYAQPQPAIYERFMRSKTTQGSMIWCWADDLICVPGRGYEYGRGTTRSHFVDEAYRMPGCGLVGDAPWGVVDGWRREKPEYWITKKLHSPVKISETLLPVPKEGGAVRVAVENQYDFTDLSELTIRWQLGAQQGKVVAHVPPRSRGEIEIPARPSADDAGPLLLNFDDAGGHLIDSYCIPIGKAWVDAPRFEPARSGELKLIQQNWLAGECSVIAGPDFRLTFDQASGLLRSGVVKAQPLLLESPVLHVLPTDRPLVPLPDLLTWRLGKLDIKKNGTGMDVRIQGRYRDFNGEYRIHVTPLGEMTVESNFEYTGSDVLAREIGLRFSVPRDVDVLEWFRRGEWNVYPEDHIGRPRGTARAFAPHHGPNPPTWPWAQDNSPMGSNDFRSTKRHIDWAGIHYEHGPGMLVFSGGSQHLRAFVATDRISVHVNDWYGGTNVGWNEWITNYGRGKPIKKGDRLASKLKMRLVPTFGGP